MFYKSVQDTRMMFFTSWSKYLKQEPLSSLEQQLVEVILDHPEYHSFLKSDMTQVETFAFSNNENPFLHMGLHLAIRDQVTLNRPEGIQSIYFQLLKKYNDRNHVEHLLLTPLKESLWQAQQSGNAPSEENFLKACQKLV